MRPPRLRLLTLIILLTSLQGWVLADGKTCGDEGLVCGDTERCCEHVMAVFSDTSAAPPYVEGKCVPQEQHCSEFWCGNRRCSAGLFGTPSVCCVNTDSGHSTEYRCAYSELSCPGNSQRLTIRDRQAEAPRTLQGG